MHRWLVGMVLVLTSCGGGNGDDSGRLEVVASFFPVAELAREIGGPAVEVHDLTPPGVEPHDLEPTSRDLDRIQDSQVVLYLGDDFQPGIARAAGRSQGPRLDLSSQVPVGDRIEGDPHAWLDPVLMRAFADEVGRTFAVVDPDEAAGYLAREDDYKRKLDALDAEYRARLATCDRRTMVTTHDAFGYLAQRYNLQQEPLTGLSPEAEPDPKRLAELADLVRAKGVTTVFAEGGEDNKSAEALAREAGVKTAVLRTLEFGTGSSYIEGMRANLAVLSEALGCQ